jgi:hypothetical protein
MDTASGLLEGIVVEYEWKQWDFNQKQLIQAAAITPLSGGIDLSFLFYFFNRIPAIHLLPR